MSHGSPCPQRFTLTFSDGRLRVLRCPGECFHDVTVKERDGYGDESVMVLDSFGMHRRTPLHRVQGNLTGIGFRDDVIQPGAHPALQAMGHGAILQCDNARPHRACVVNDFSQQQQEDTHIDWSASSHDLNPIEHLWDVLGG